MLSTLGINQLAKKKYLDMSTGQKKRLHIVFLGEPTVGLDVEGKISLHNLNLPKH